LAIDLLAKYNSPISRWYTVATVKYKLWEEEYGHGPSGEASERKSRHTPGPDGQTMQAETVQSIDDCAASSFVFG
jgi:hypothetical protein